MRFVACTRLSAALTLVVLTACSGPEALPTATAPALDRELVFYDWADDMPQSVLDAFTAEFGVEVTYETYESSEEAVENIELGHVYDVVVNDNDAIPWMVHNGLLAEIDFRNVPNFRNISPNFRDLTYDPGNEHSVPFNWGTTGFVVRGDLVEEPPTHWADLWEPRFAGKIAVREDVPFDMIGLTLRSLGYGLNSEDPEELASVERRLLELRPDVILVGPVAQAALPVLLSGEAVILVGWAEDVVAGREENDAITYVLPEEGTMLWGDSFTIPANSPRKHTAEVFLNFMLRPAIGAQITNENYYATANQAALDLVAPEIRDDPVIFPASEDLENAEVFLPISDEDEVRYREIWERFLAAGP